MELSEKDVERLLFLAVTSQSMIDVIEDGIGVFRHREKLQANTFKENLLAKLNKDLGSALAVEELINMSQWIYDMFIINHKIVKYPVNIQEDFSKELKNLFVKYNLI